jgi:hypothetical protein
MQNVNLFPGLQPPQVKDHHGTYLEGKLITSTAWLSLRNPSALQVYCILTSQIVKLKANGKKSRKGKGSLQEENQEGILQNSEAGKHGLISKVHAFPHVKIFRNGLNDMRKRM